MSEDVLKAMLEEAKGQILEYEAVFARLMSAPLVYATVVKSNNQFNLAAFEQGDMMLIIDREWRRNEKRPRYGRIVSKGVNKEEGTVTLMLPNGAAQKFYIGLDGNVPQVKLIGKDDGTNCVIVVNGNQFEVHGVPGKKFSPSETVKVDMQTYQIHDTAGVTGAGTICNVSKLLDEEHVEVNIDAKPRVALHGLPGQKLEPGDRVVLDPSDTVVVRLLERDGADRFNLEEESKITWNDIAGLADAKEQLIEAIELPYIKPEVFAHYNKRPPKGALLYGPPGCGKTLCAKAAASSIAKIHKKKQMQSGFIYVKGPELLSKWVGAAEESIRELFLRGRDHYEKHGYPALLFIDEADAIMPERGSGKSSDVENTIVPMFLSEMDGLESSKVCVLLATNQPKRLDPAVVREGRIDRHIRIGRPTTKTAGEYFRIHLRGVPLVGCEPAEVAAHVTAEIFSSSRVMYKLAESGKPDHFMTLGDCVSGAMIAGIIDIATSLAMRRDLKSKGGVLTGVTLDDFREAVHRTYVNHLGLNNKFDIEDYADARGINLCNISVEKFIPAAA